MSPHPSADAGATSAPLVTTKARSERAVDHGCHAYPSGRCGQSRQPPSVELFGFNGFMASLALAMIMLPTITRTVEVVLRLVPDGLREASLAMGASRARTVWSVVLPTARSGITTAVVLGIARAVGETAPLLFTAFGFTLMNGSPSA